MPNSKFWSWTKAEANGADELYIDGVIAQESWFDDDVTPAQFRAELEAHSGDVVVRINSPGGDVFAGVSIYNMLMEHEGKVTVKVDGVAASIASLIAMAGDHIAMLPGSMMMVHRPWTFAMGNSENLEEVAEMLKKVGESMVPIYVSATGLSEDRVNELLDAETWMTAEDAVELGFADEAVEAKTRVSDSIKSAIEYAKTVQNAVTQPAMAMAQRLPDQKKEEVKVNNYTDTTKTNDEAAAEESTQQTPAPATDETVEQTEETSTEKVEAKAVKSTNKNKEAEMPKTTQDEIAATQALAPDAQAKPEATNVVDYLKNEQSIRDFSAVLYNNAGGSTQDIQDEWRGLLVKNGITDPDKLALPEPLVTEILDAVDGSEIWGKLNHTGLDSFKVLWDKTDQDADTSRAGGHNPGDTKSEQVLDFLERVLGADYIYKYLVLDKKTIRENRGSGALMRFVMRELPQRIVREMERAVVIGDGRTAGDDRKIDSFVSIKSDAVAGNTFAETYTPAAGESRAETVAKAKDELRAEGTVYLIAKKGYATAARFEKDNNGDLLFPLGTTAQTVFDVAGVIEPQWFTDANDSAYDAYVVVLSGYYTVGDANIEAFTNFKLETNENQFLQEIYKGGGLAELKAAVGISSSVASS